MRRQFFLHIDRLRAQADPPPILRHWQLVLK